MNAICDKVSGEFNFEVNKFPLSGPDNMRTEWYGLFRSGTNETVGSGSVSRIYVPHQTDDVLALVEAASNAFNGIADVDCYFRDGHYVSITPTDQQRISVFGNKDNIFPRVIIRAGYDGKAFQASIGYYRDLCRNLHRMKRASNTTVSIRHTSGLRGKMNSLIESFQMIQSGWTSLAEVVTRMESRRVSAVEFLTSIYGEPPTEEGRGLTIHKNRTAAIFNRLSSERERSGREPLTANNNWEVSVWEAFNMVQGYVQHAATRKGGVTNLFARAILADSDLSVNKAEALAMEMIAA